MQILYMLENICTCVKQKPVGRDSELTFDIFSKLWIRFFHRSHNTVHFGGVFALKQWIMSSLKHDTVPRVNNLYCFYVKNPPKRVVLWDRENSQWAFLLAWSVNEDLFFPWFVNLCLSVLGKLVFHFFVIREIFINSRVICDPTIFAGRE